MAMAQTILTLCDLHLLDDDAHEPGEEWRFGVAGPGEKWEWHAIDLCALHGEQFSTMAAALRKYGRPEQAPAPRAATARGPYAPRVTREPTPDGEYRCDFCPRTFPRKQGVSMHMTRTHAAEKEAAQAAIPQGETPQERRRRLERERKARKRAALAAG